MTRVAAIDLGTNATRLLVADVDDGHVDEILRRTRITRLGEGVDARRRLLPAPIARVRNTRLDVGLIKVGGDATEDGATCSMSDGSGPRPALIVGTADSDLEKAFAFVAVVFGTINVVGGFLVTDRMLEMFKQRRPDDDAE